jgi:acetyl esterase/lipase
MRAQFAKLIAMTGALGLAAAAHAASPGEELAAKAVVNPAIFSAGGDPYPDHHATFAGGVTGLPELAYSIIPGYRPMKLDLYLPPVSYSAKGPRPAVVFVHGGGWARGGPRLSGAFDNWPNVLASIAARGYVVASVSYRFSSEAASPAAIQDVKSALRWLRVNAVKYQIDKGRVMVWGASAGGQLAALAATSCGVAALEPPAPAVAGPALVESQTTGGSNAQPQSDCVQGAVTWYGVFDFSAMPQGGEQSPYLGCGKDACTPEQLREPSPIAYVSEMTPPMLMIAGSDDHTVPPAQSKDFYAALQAKHVPSALMIIPGVDHSFIGKTPDATRDASKAALARTVDFIDNIIGDRAGR